MATPTKEAELRDEVKHTLNDTAGIVIAKYTDNAQPAWLRPRLDVRGTDDKIYYNTPLVHWLVTKVCDE